MLQQLNGELASVVEMVGQGLVQVLNGRGSAGAGTIWHPDGLVVTCAHVLGRGPLRVRLPDGSSFPARMLASVHGHDLAALAVDATGLSVIELGASSRLQAGQWVMALGHPWGVVGAATAGVVIGMGREGEEASPHGRDWITVSLHLRPGYSGGPLVDAHGRLVGVNTMMVGPDVGVAVPVHAAKAFLRETVGSRCAVSPV